MMPSQTVFLALDPILKMLLSSVESYREACTNGEKALQEERILGTLSIQVRLMDNLERNIKEAVDKHGAGVLQGLFDYILLPLRLILQSSGWSDNTNEPIRQSAVWKSIEAAARVLDCIFLLAGTSTTFKQTLDCLTACTFPLPMEQISRKGLDRGDDCLYAVLRCIDTLLEHISEQQSQICMEMEGNLVARISFACTIILAPDNKSSRKKSQEVQLQALETLDLLMKVVPDPEMWQSYFPGLFAVLYGLVLSDLKIAPAHASPKVSAHSCVTLSRLLSVTLSTEHNEVGETDVWAKVERMTIHYGTTQESDSAFLTQVYSRLPAPLMLLLNLLPTASSSKLRLAASELCHSIVVETHSVWDNDETSNVFRSAMECCIALSRDKDERVESAAKSTIADYRHDSGNSGKPQVDNTIGPRLLELIEELPALARSGRETELRGKINLISGYLNLGESLRSSLTSVPKEIQSSLAVLFDVDFDSIQYAPRVESADAWNVWQPDQCRFRFMMDDTAMLAREMIRLLGNTLGQKGASLFVDACIADILEACMATSHTLFGPRQVDWLHQWIGFIVISNEVLVGAFDEKYSSPGSSDMARSSQKDEKLNKQCRKRYRILHALAGAILPVITSDPLWSLPTVLDNIERIEQAETHGTVTVTEIQDQLKGQAETVSASALKGNAAIVCSLIGLVNEMVDLLANDAESFLSTVLYPLCERASSQNHSQVQRTAAFVLHRYAMACRLESTKELICQNFDYLFGAMLSKTRFPIGHLRGRRTSFPRDISSIMQAVLRSASDVKTHANFVRSLSDETHISLVIELSNALVVSFDSNLSILNNDPSLQASTAMDLVEVLDASLSFIASTFGLNLGSAHYLSAEVEIPEPSKDWMATLKPFRLRSSLDHDDLSVMEAFEKFREKNGDEDENHNAETQKVNVTHPSIEITDNELDFVSLALSRCSFFLSSPALHVDMASCVGIQHAFEFLGLIAKYSHPKEDDEPNGPQTAILRHIAVSFPSIISRIRSLSSAVVAANSIRRVSIRMLDISTESPDVSTEMIFLSKLLNLVACMSQVSGSFLVDRIRQQVWPIIAELLDVFVRLGKETSRKQPSTDNLAFNELVQGETVVTEREKLLFSILDFLSRIYGQRECGMGLTDLIPTVGTIIIPFLANHGELRDRTLRALKTIMLIDCDALWRPLLQLSHHPLPPRPFGHKDSCIAVVNPDQECTTPLELAAEELVAFVDSLPEQTL